MLIWGSWFGRHFSVCGLLLLIHTRRIHDRLTELCAPGSGNSVCCWAWLAQLLQRAHDLPDLESTSERHCISSVNSQAFTRGLTPLAVLATVPLFPLSLKSHLLSLGLESTCKGLLQVPAFSAPPPFPAQHLALPFRVT